MAQPKKVKSDIERDIEAVARAIDPIWGGRVPYAALDRLSTELTRLRAIESAAREVNERASSTLGETDVCYVGGRQILALRSALSPEGEPS